ncbi:MAG: amidohydrolase family protein, partial [Candidatus Marinimicrobia bacterium]|nr:amidohydrolase family protein [Candidatus Neomarinimicrobiota bacterium]
YRKFRNLYQNRVHRGPRLSVYIYHQDKDNVLDYNMKSGDGGYWLRFMGLKYFLDGALGSQTAWLQKAYENSNSLGIQLWKKDDIRKELTDIRNNNTIKVAIHAIGDAAFDEALDLFENSNFYNDIPDRIEHGQLCNEEILEKLKNRKLGICTNPSHLLSDFPTAEKYWGERSRYAFALKSLEKSGQIITMGSDAPVESINPWLGIMAAVYRVPQYSGIPWYAEECISLESALKMNTYNPAILSGEKNKKGLLMPGYLADLFVCSKDPFNAEMADMQSIRSLLTIIDGQVVYNRLSNLI